MSNANTLSILHQIESYGPDGKYLPVARVLDQELVVARMFPWFEGNGVDTHVVRKDADLGTSYRRRDNQGTPGSRTFKVNVTESKMGWARQIDIDKRVADAGGDPGKTRLEELAGALEGLGQEVENDYLNGDESSDPESINGLLTRRNDPSANPSLYVNGLASTATSTCMSVLLVGRGKRGVYCWYPRGSKAGITRQNYGDTLRDDTNGSLPMYRERVEFQGGLAVADDRYLIRAHSIDRTQPLDGGADMIEVMIEMLGKLKRMDMDPLFIMSREAWIRTWQQGNNRRDGNVTSDNLAGKPVFVFYGVPVMISDRMSVNESGEN